MFIYYDNSEIVNFNATALIILFPSLTKVTNSNISAKYIVFNEQNKPEFDEETNLLGNVYMFNSDSFDKLSEILRDGIDTATQVEEAKDFIYSHNEFNPTLYLNEPFSAHLNWEDGEVISV